MSAGEVKLHPAWRQALADLLLDGLAPGSVIDKDWLNNAFGLTAPRTIAEAEKQRLLFLSMFSGLRTELLEQHRLMLRPVQGVGYEVIDPRRQTEVAQRDRFRTVRRELRHLVAELSFVQHDQLSPAQRQANSDALARVGVLAGMARLKAAGHQDVESK